MFLPPDSQMTLTQALNNLVQVQRELRKLLRDCAVSEASSPRHSLFSSKRVFRSDELFLGLNKHQAKRFSAN